MIHDIRKTQQAKPTFLYLFLKISRFVIKLKENDKIMFFSQHDNILFLF